MVRLSDVWRGQAPHYAEIYQAQGWVRIPSFLAEAEASTLYQHLKSRTDWRQVLNSGDKVIELDRTARAGMGVTQRDRLDDAVYAAARTGFQYRYETIRVADDRLAGAPESPLTDFADHMRSSEVLNALRMITGSEDINFADAQATAYSPGDFLTAHDDAVDGKGRRAAYVYGLTPVWRIEWGGLLLFHQNSAVQGLAPEGNALTIFSVPRIHSVSEVTRAAPYRRYSVTGWLRCLED